jgi:hypothetical protein
MTRHFFLRKFVKKMNLDGIFSTQIREKMNRNDTLKKKMNRYGTFLTFLDRFKNHIFYERK